MVKLTAPPRELWVLQYRTRERKNGKWTEWQMSDRAGYPLSGFTENPSSELKMNSTYYERRAVKYTLAPEVTGG